MRSKQFSLLIILAIIAGFPGGAFSAKIFNEKPALAQNANLQGNIIEAGAFRLIDSERRTRATLKMRMDNTPGLSFIDQN